MLLTLAELSLAQGSLLACEERALEAERVARDIPRVVHCIHALGVAGQSRAALGRSSEALSMAREAATLARARGRVDTVPELLAAAAAARALCAGGEPGEALMLLPSPTGRGTVGLQDPIRVVWAIRARALSLSRPEEAREAIQETMARAPSRLPWTGAREQLDLAAALVQCGASSAQREVARSVETAHDSGLWMYELESLELQRRLSSTEAIVDRMDGLRTKLASTLSESEYFVRRWT